MSVATFPLISPRRGTGLLGGTRRSARRGAGSEIASLRPYRRGDSVRAIDWKASARASSTREGDDFVIREHFAEDSPRVVVVVDRRPGMSLFPAELPWLHKPAAVAEAGRMVAESALAARGLPGYLDLADPRNPAWLPPQRQLNATRMRERELRRDAFTAPPENLTLAFRLLARSRRELPAGTFVFVLSDFLVSPSPAAWRTMLSLGWDVVPVVIQDPRWEQSFPDVAGLALPVTAPGDGRLRLVRLTRREASARRQANERRREELLQTFRSLGLDPVLLSTHEPVEILSAFLAWHERRLLRMRRR